LISRIVPRPRAWIPDYWYQVVTRWFAPLARRLSERADGASLYINAPELPIYYSSFLSYSWLYKPSKFFKT
jgi:hypothetical protein